MLTSANLERRCTVGEYIEPVDASVFWRLSAPESDFRVAGMTLWWMLLLLPPTNGIMTNLKLRIHATIDKSMILGLASGQKY